MQENKYTIDIDESRHPYNAYLVLPLDVLEQLAPVLLSEIMCGAASTGENDTVILQLFLTKDKIEELKKTYVVTETKVAAA